jgi:hypothetical protein
MGAECAPIPKIKTRDLPTGGSVEVIITKKNPLCGHLVHLVGQSLTTEALDPNLAKPGLKIPGLL